MYIPLLIRRFNSHYQSSLVLLGWDGDVAGQYQLSTEQAVKRVTLDLPFGLHLFANCQTDGLAAGDLYPGVLTEQRSIRT